MNCLWCDAEIIPETNWQNLLLPDNETIICDACKENLEPLDGSRCRKCSRESGDIMCSDCIWWERQSQSDDPLTYNYSVFPYNPAIQEMIFRWKYRGDYCLGNLFMKDYQRAFGEVVKRLTADTIVVPIPLSDERLAERGFNQSAMLSGFLPLKSMDLFVRTHSEKQSKKNRHERVAAANPFKLMHGINKPVLLADDIYTTGATLRHAAGLLKEHGCPSVHALTLIRG